VSAPYCEQEQVGGCDIGRTTIYLHILKNEQESPRSLLDILPEYEAQTREAGGRQDKSRVGSQLTKWAWLRGIVVAVRSIRSAVRVCTSTYCEDDP